MTDACELGRIAEITESSYKVILDQEAGCSSCGMKELCSSKEIWIDRRDVIEELKLNDPVEITFEKVVQTSFILYILPLLFFFAAIIVSQALFQIENALYQFVIGLSAMTVSFFIIRWTYGLLDKEAYKIKVKRKHSNSIPSLSTGRSHAF